MKYNIRDKFRESLANLEWTITSCKEIFLPQDYLCEYKLECLSCQLYTTMTMTEKQIDDNLKAGAFVILQTNASPNIENLKIKITKNHDNHEVVLNSVAGKEFKYCRDCRVEV